ncbi:trigger factor [bacterium]|nr:trigger factor [bacterium]
MADETAVTEGEVADEQKRIELSVEMTDAGPCKKHVRVEIPQVEVDKFFDREFTDLVRKSAVPGFRPGKAPRRLIEKRFREDVSDKVKSMILMQSMEQVGEDQKLDVLTEPNLDVNSINLPTEGPFVYEFEVEVRPAFDLPSYDGLQIERPAKEFKDADIDTAMTNFLRREGEMKPKAGAVADDDYIDVDIRFVTDGVVVREFEQITVRVDDELTFRDGLIEKFAKGIIGAKEGETRDFKVKMADGVARKELAGKEIDAQFVVKEVKELIPATLGPGLFSTAGVSDEGELRDEIRVSLERRLEHAQRQACSDQIMNQLIGKTKIDLPQDLLKRQTERALARRLVELERAGYGEEEVKAHINRLRQDSMSSTARALREQFILQAIAEAESIKIDEPDLDEEIEEIARRSGESVRRVRSRVEKDGLWEALASQVLERKTIAAIVAKAKVKNVPWKDEVLSSSAVDEAAVPELPESASSEEPADDQA